MTDLTPRTGGDGATPSARPKRKWFPMVVLGLVLVAGGVIVTCSGGASGAVFDPLEPPDEPGSVVRTLVVVARKHTGGCVRYRSSSWVWRPVMRSFTSKTMPTGDACAQK